MADNDTTPKDFTNAIYQAITSTFGSNNPKQMFCLCWPGTVLDYDRLAWSKDEEIAGNMPEHALVRSSLILDQYVPPAPITQPDGTRVSDRYREAISQFGPIPNAALAKLQAIIRDRLQTTVVQTIDGKDQTFRLVGWFDYLYAQWTSAKKVWADKQAAMLAGFKAQNPNDPDKAWDAYLAWFETAADGYIQDINGKWEQLVSEFPLTSWQDAIAILDTRDSGGLDEAKLLMQNAILPIPQQEGVDYAPTQGVPYDWPLELAPVTKFLDLLADPEAQRQALDTAIGQLSEESFAWMAILPQVSDSQIESDAKAFNESVQGYSNAQSALLKTYASNAVQAVKIYCEIQKSRGGSLSTLDAQSQPDVEKQVKNLQANLDQQNPDGAKSTSGEETDLTKWDTISDIAQQVAEGQNSLIDKQQGLIDAGNALAGSADRFLADQANRSQFPWLPAYVDELKSKLQALQTQEANLASASNVYYKYLNAPGASAAPDPNASSDFGSNAFPSSLDTPASDRWTEVVATIDMSQLQSSTRMNTYFEASQWGVDLFFGSAGGSSQSSSSNFASSYMKSDSKIQIGFLATKVLIERPWMKPEIFANTANFFRTMKTPLAPAPQMTQDEVTGPANKSMLLNLLENYSFPAYPVAVLLVKDVTVKVQLDASKTEDARSASKSSQSEGGGFLCFSISKTQSTQAQSESMSSYAMAGQLIARAPAPQIIGYWVEFMPPDNSKVIDEPTANAIAGALGFVTKLAAVHEAGEAVKATPTRT